QLSYGPLRGDVWGWDRSVKVAPVSGKSGKLLWPRGTGGAAAPLYSAARRMDLLPADGSSPMIALANLLNTVITIYIWVLIASAILSWLIAFNVINTRNPFVYRLGEFLYRITDPALRPIRNVLPSFGGIDVSPVVLILALVFVRDLINEYLRY